LDEEAEVAAVESSIFESSICAMKWDATLKKSAALAFSRLGVVGGAALNGDSKHGPEVNILARIT
jgi:hypothetical protein